MNTCQYQSKLQTYYDNELPQDQTTQLENHLQSCATCQAELASLADMSLLLTHAELPALRPLALEQIHQHLDVRIDQQVRQAAEQGPLQLAKWLTGVAAVVLLACSMQLFFVQNSLSRNSSAEIAPSLAWETTTAMLNQDNPATPAVSDEHSLAAWIVSDLSAQASGSYTSTQE